MAKAASSALSSVSTGGSGVIDAGLKATGNKTISEMAQDPFGAKAVANEQEQRNKDALKQIRDTKLKSKSTTDSSSKTKSSSKTTSKNVTDSSSQTASNQVSRTSFDRAGATEQALMADQLAAYRQQQGLVADQERAILERQGLQTGARDTLGGVLSGQSFNLTADEQARINSLRDANIDVSRSAVDDLLTQRLAEVEADAARRGIRGQGFTQLQGDAIGEAARNLRDATLSANQIAANQALEMPGQRVGVQANAAGQFAGFSDQLQQQAIQNASMLQDPVLREQLMAERLAAVTQTTTGNTSTTGRSVATGTSNTQGTSSTTGSSTTSGVRDADPTQFLAAVAGAGGPKANTIAGNMAGIGAITDVAGAAAPFFTGG